jgi:hypothetical protein
VRHRHLAGYIVDLDLVDGGEFDEMRLRLFGKVEQCLGAENRTRFHLF